MNELQTSVSDHVAETSVARKRIIIIEDDGEVLQGWQETLSTAGLVVTSASHMEDGAKLLLDVEPNGGVVIVLDVMLPSTQTDLDRIRRKAQEQEGYWDELWAKPAGTEAYREALTKLRRIDREIFALLDMKGGLKLMDGVRQRTLPTQNQCEVRTVYVTARQDPVLIQEAESLHKSGTMEWLVKPVLPSEVLAAVRRLSAEETA